MPGEAQIGSLVQQGLGNQMSMLSGGMQLGMGIGQMIAGNKNLKYLNQTRPQYQVSPEIAYNRDLTRNYANQGLGSQYLNLAAEQQNRALGAGIGALMSGGNADINQINRLLDSSTNSYKQMLTQDYQARQANRNQFLQANTALANENRAAWDYNVNLPWQQKFNAANAMSQAGPQNIQGGMNGIAQSFYGQVNQANNAYQGYQSAQPNYGGVPTTGQPDYPAPTVFSMGNYNLQGFPK